MFYGTETSLEFDEELDKDKPSPAVVHTDTNNDNSANDGRHEIVNPDEDSWTGRQQVDLISHPEVQKPTTENQTSGSCRNFDDHGCLGGCLLILLLLQTLTWKSR